MKILLLANKFPYPPNDGGSRSTRGFIKGISEQANSVTLLSFITSKHKSNSFNQSAYSEKIEAHQVSIDTTPRLTGALVNFLFSVKPYIESRFSSDKYKNKLIELLSNNSYDIIQFEGLYMLQYFETCKQYSNAKLCYRPHNMEHEVWSTNASIAKSIVHRWYFKNLSKRILKLEKSYINMYDAITPVCQHDIDYLKANGNEKPHFLITTGFEVEKISQGESNKDIIFIGALDWEPNVYGLKWFVLNVWEGVSRKYENVNFHVAGRNPSKEIEEFLLSKNVNFMGEIDSPTEIYNKGKIVVVPLFSGGGIRLKIMEALGYGKAVVTTSEGLKGSYAIADEHVLIADTSANFITQIELLLNNKDVSNDLGNRAKAFYEENYNSIVDFEGLNSFFKATL